MILWKVMRLAALGAWSGGGRTQGAVDAWAAGDTHGALRAVQGASSIRARVAAAGFVAVETPEFSAHDAEAEITRVAKAELAEARRGLKALDMIATIAPLLGLLGTVVGMIAAFQAMQAAGARTDPAALAGGIWEALLTTAAGMAVAIPATMALGWFESVIDRLRGDLEDIGTCILLPRKAPTRSVAEAAE
ncbi:MAG: MotA/TolQ/ExbB proton channel family protein [Pseudomonadota bacterium]